MSKNAAGVEIFNGFQIEYPEYSVITPHTLLEFSIRTLTVSEEEKLKGSLLTPNKLAGHLNEVIFNCLCKKPDTITTYQDFLNKLTIKDRDALMYGLYHVTYKDIHNYDVECSQCQFVNSVKINFEKGFRATLWPKDSEKNVLETEIPILGDECLNLFAIADLKEKEVKKLKRKGYRINSLCESLLKKIQDNSYGKYEKKWRDYFFWDLYFHNRNFIKAQCSIFFFIINVFNCFI